MMKPATPEQEGRFTFIAAETGVYRFCFNNQMSSVTPKTVRPFPTLESS